MDIADAIRKPDAYLMLKCSTCGDGYQEPLFNWSMDDGGNITGLAGSGADFCPACGEKSVTVGVRIGEEHLLGEEGP